MENNGEKRFRVQRFRGLGIPVNLPKKFIFKTKTY